MIKRFNMQPALGSACSQVSSNSIDVLVTFDLVLISVHCVNCLFEFNIIIMFCSKDGPAPNTCLQCLVVRALLCKQRGHGFKFP